MKLVFCILWLHFSITVGLCYFVNSSMEAETSFSLLVLFVSLCIWCSINITFFMDLRCLILQLIHRVARVSPIEYI